MIIMQKYYWIVFQIECYYDCQKKLSNSKWLVNYKTQEYLSFYYAILREKPISSIITKVKDDEYEKHWGFEFRKNI